MRENEKTLFQLSFWNRVTSANPPQRTCCCVSEGDQHGAQTGVLLIRSSQSLNSKVHFEPVASTFSVSLSLFLCFSAEEP